MNKPVAWMQEFECSKTGQKRRRLEFEQIGVNDIPLYTHPVKELTEWIGAEEWEPLAWELCADEHGEESCTDLIWDMGVIPEPWGDRWQKYEDEAKRMISMVRKCTHPVKELHLSLQKEKETGELLAVTYTDDEHRIVEVLWEKPPVKELTDDVAKHHYNKGHEDGRKLATVKELTDEEIMDYVEAFSIDMGNVYEFQPDNVLQMIRAILDKAQEK